MVTLTKISFYLLQISCQQVVISQASKALNLSSSTIEFSGSAEEVERECLLLVASMIIFLLIYQYSFSQ